MKKPLPSVLNAGILLRLGHRRFVVVLGPLASAWDGGRDIRQIHRKLRETLGTDLTGLDLTDAFAAEKGRPALVEELRPLASHGPGRIHELIVTLRPPWIFSFDMSGTITRAGVSLKTETIECYLEKDSIRQQGPDRLVVVPILGHLANPGTLILTDKDEGTFRRRRDLALRFLRERAADSEFLLLGFAPSDNHLRDLMLALSPDLQRFDQKMLVGVESPSGTEIAQLERRHCRIFCTSAREAVEIFESLPGHIREAALAAPAGESALTDSTVDRLRKKICDDTRHIVTLGIWQPEHLEIGESPTLDDIYVLPTLSTWEPAEHEIDRSELERLARECEEAGGSVPAIVCDLLGRSGKRGGKGVSRPPAAGWDKSGDSGLPDALRSIGYPLKKAVERFAAADPLNVLAKTRRMVVIGEPASGKSHLLRYIAHRITSGAAGALPHFRNLVPLIIPIREFHARAGTGPPFAAYAHKCLANLIGEEPASVERLFAESQVMLLLDGLDEVPGDDERRKVAAQIDEFVTEAGKDFCCVITSRPAGYRAARLTGDMPHLRLDLFDEDRIRDLLVRWYTWTQLRENKSEEEAKERASGLAEQLYSNLGVFEGLFDLCRNPLMLTIATFIHMAGLELPQRRADFYGRATEVLTQRWLQVKFHGRIALPGNDTMLAALEEFGFALHTGSPENVMPGKDFLELLERVFRDREGSGRELAHRQAVNLRDLARNLMGIVVERGADRFGFVHLTFQEYFAARHLAVGSGRHLAMETLARNLYQPRWDEVIRMYLQVAPMTDARAVFDRLLRVRHPFDEYFHPLPRRLADFLIENNGVSRQQRDGVLKDLIELIGAVACGALRADAIVKAGRVKNFGAFPEAVPVLLETIRSENDSSVRVAALVVLALLAESNPEVLNAILNTLRDEDWHVRLTAVHVLAPLAGSNPQVLDAILNTLRDEDWRVRLTAVHALAPLARSNPEVLNAILISLRDEDLSVRQAAVEALAPPAGSNPIVLDALLNTLGDEDSDVRQAAVQALAPPAASNPEVLNAILNTLGDEDPSVRWSSVQVLGPLAGSNPEVLDAILNSLRDEDSRVRRAAVEALAPPAASNPNVLNAILNSLRDEDPGVRWAAVRALAPPAGSNPNVLNAVLNSLRDEDSRVRRAAVEALAPPAASNPNVLNAILNSLRDEDPGVRWAAVRALAPPAGSNPNVLNAILNSLGDKDWNVRQTAVEALAPPAESNPNVLNAIMRTWKDEVSEVRHTAREALCPLAASNPEVRDAFLKDLLKGGNTFESSIAWRALAGSIHAENWREIQELLDAASAAERGAPFQALNPMTAAWDFESEGLVYENGGWIFKKQLHPTAGSTAAGTEPGTAPDLLRLRELVSRKKNPSGLDGLNSELKFLKEQYPVVPKRERGRIRAAASRWFIAGAGAVNLSTQDNRQALLADLRDLARFLNHLSMAIRDEDREIKLKLFAKIWPTVSGLFDRGILHDETVANQVFETLNRLYLYLPGTEQGKIEATLERWLSQAGEKAKAGEKPDHPILKSAPVNQILKTAGTRKTR